MELRHLRYFVAVAEEESIARAARRLHVSEPPLSRQVRDLESELGVALLERGPRSIRLTEAGRRFLPEARGVLARAGRAVAAVAVRSPSPPTLRMGVLGPGHLPRLRRALERARLAWPDLRLEFDHAPAGPLLERLAQGQLDVACVNLPLHSEARARVDRREWGCRTVYRGPLMAVLPAAHLLARGRRVALAELAGEEFILPGGAGRLDLGEIILGACRGVGFEPRAARWLEGPLSELVAAVAVGPGVSVLPDSLRCVRLPGVVYRPLAAPAPVISYALVWPAAALARGDGPLRSLLGGNERLPGRSF